MLRLNMSHQLPTTGLNIRHSSVDDAHMIPAQVHTNNRQARSNKTATQVKVDINSYPSRKAYGHRTMNDLTKENGQKGISDVQSSNSGHTQSAWSFIENAAKKGNYIHQRAEQNLYSEAKKTRRLEIQDIPDPQFSVEPSEVIGEPDLGDVTAEIQTQPFASVKCTTGSAQTYVQDKGFLHRWITQDKYDMYV